MFSYDKRSLRISTLFFSVPLFNHIIEIRILKMVYRKRHSLLVYIQLPRETRDDLAPLA